MLDFFAGSGTTAHAVLDLNREDEGNRKFILVTNNENQIGIKVTYERLHRIITGKTSDNKAGFDWLKKHTPYYGTPLRVFNLRHFDVEVNQVGYLEDINQFAIENLKKLNPNYCPNNLQIYYDLDGLNPLINGQKEQIYSTNEIIHGADELLNGKSKKFYCKCNQSFESNTELNEHLKRIKQCN